MTEIQDKQQVVPTAGSADRVELNAAPKPAVGRRWRKWLAEVGVVVIGVLLALGADQVASTIS